MTATQQTRHATVSAELVEEVVAYTRIHLGAAVAADLGAESSDPADLVLDAVCMLSCAGAFPPPPLGTAMLQAVQTVDLPERRRPSP